MDQGLEIGPLSLRPQFGAEYDVKEIRNIERLRGEEADPLVRMEKSVGVQLAFRAEPNYPIENFKIINANTGEEYR